MNDLVKYFWLFIVEPENFYSDWFSNCNDLIVVLNKLVFIMIIAELFWHISFLVYSLKKSHQNINQDILFTNSEFIDFLIDKIVIVILAIICSKMIYESIVFMHLIFILCCLLIVFFALLGITVSFIFSFFFFLLANISESSINESIIEKVVEIILYFFGYLAVFFFVRNYVISISSFFGISWWIVVILSSVLSYYDILFKYLKPIFSQINLRKR